MSSNLSRATRTLLVAGIASSPVIFVAAAFSPTTATQGNNVNNKHHYYLPAKSTLFSSSRPQNSFNPFRMVGDLASGLLGGERLEPRPAVEAAVGRIATVPSWPNLVANLESRMKSDDECHFRANLAKGYGVGSPLHKIRLFDETNRESDIRVKFYRDSASWCPYCQKVWLMLEEKKIPYRVEKINMRCYGDKPNSFLRLQPNGAIPVAEIDGRVYGQSNDIMYVLEELFTPDEGGHKSLSPPAPQQDAARDLLRLERELFSAWMYWLTGGGQSSKTSFIQVLGKVERSLAQRGPFFMGTDVTLVDFMYASFLERMAASLLYFKGFMIRVPPGEATDFPAVNKWFDAMEELESYQLTKSDYYTHAFDLPPQLGGCRYEPGCEPYEKAINGERTLDGSRGSWELPLIPHNGGVEPDWTWAAATDGVAQREAVERVSANHEAIVKFACRGAGKKGVPPVMAPLSDPNAVPSEVVQSAVDACLRMVLQALLEGVESQNDPMTTLATTIVKEGGADFAMGVIDSLAYLRDRVGVPRDMKLPAARQLRAHLNWAIAKLSDAKDAAA